ncbi:AvaI/BsoBI family type II restriction endonuclease [Listeria booriae]|uniref:Restriction endonuclease n=1 Tax=Listeria booriae TaxID=1552123 RepID=A0A7X0TMB4_9LIST|nr:AvaI/BsoBI family type II restriction endonuclease [Listeria booriae]MBC1331849.1 restriction endonuclease [Listeria booriae]MBC2371270.1 restriction endonuclease [Listeria booriae]MBC2387626.1 restriction endonuclease [Listeria booriae]
MKLKDYTELVTSHEETKNGFINFSIEKNKLATPIIENINNIYQELSLVSEPSELLKRESMTPILLTASGLSDKALKHLTEKDKKEAIDALISNFLIPAKGNFANELIYRYLLIKGDSLGGTMRNVVGNLAQAKLVRALLDEFESNDIDYHYYLSNETKKAWRNHTIDVVGSEGFIKAISWEFEGVEKTLGFNLKVPLVRKNIDICLFECGLEAFEFGKVVNDPQKALMFGELKGGVDPAGADEHWKTANSALERIRSAFKGEKEVMTSFIGAAIVNDMAKEIYNQVELRVLSKAVNLSKEEQLVEYCQWLISL